MNEKQIKALGAEKMNSLLQIDLVKEFDGALKDGKVDEKVLKGWFRRVGMNEPQGEGSDKIFTFISSKFTEAQKSEKDVFKKLINTIVEEVQPGSYSDVRQFGRKLQHVYTAQKAFNAKSWTLKTYICRVAIDESDGDNEGTVVYVPLMQLTTEPK